MQSNVTSYRRANPFGNRKSLCVVRCIRTTVWHCCSFVVSQQGSAPAWAVCSNSRARNDAVDELNSSKCDVLPYTEGYE